MSKATNDTTPPCQRPRLTYEEAEMIWKARDVYRARQSLWAFLIFCGLLELLPALYYRDFWPVMTLIGAQITVLFGLRWVLRHGLRWLRTWWHGAVLVVVLGSVLTGCADMARGWASVYGLPDPSTQHCAPESLQAGQCIPMKQDAAKPAEGKP